MPTFFRTTVPGADHQLVLQVDGRNLAVARSDGGEFRAGKLCRVTSGQPQVSNHGLSPEGHLTGFPESHRKVGRQFSFWAHLMVADERVWCGARVNWDGNLNTDPELGTTAHVEQVPESEVGDLAELFG